MPIQDLRGTEFSLEPHPESRSKEILIGLQGQPLIKPEIKDFRPLERGIDLHMADNIVNQAEAKAASLAGDAEKAASQVAAAVEAGPKAAVADVKSWWARIWPHIVTFVGGSTVGHFALGKALALISKFL